MVGSELRDAVPEVALVCEMCLNFGAGATCPSIPPTLTVDNDLQLLEVETLRRDGSFSPTGRLKAKTAGTPGPLRHAAPAIAVTLHSTGAPEQSPPPDICALAPSPIWATTVNTRDCSVESPPTGNPRPELHEMAPPLGGSYLFLQKESAE